MNRVWIGTSGWSYKHWAESFYGDIPRKREFEFYSTQFPIVEINATFYRLPSKTLVTGWQEKAPEGFLFAVKGSRFITHMKKLKGVSRGLKKYITRIKPLGKHLGPILWQLPPNLHKDVERLEAFLKSLPDQFRHAVEFRHTSWLDAECFSVLQKHNAAAVWLSSKEMPMVDEVTADFIYLRFHGLKNGAAHDYTKKELEPWARKLRDCRGKQAFVYFNNDLNTRAPHNARMLADLVGAVAVPPCSDD